MFKNRIFLFVILILTLAFYVGCVKEPESRISKKLGIILDDDMQAILEGVSDTNLLDSTFYDITFYKSYTGAKYSQKAIVDFYFLKNIDMKIVRKYRYQRELKMWDRYYNEYHLIDKKNDNAKVK